MRTPGRIAALILAAGRSSRMGFPKPLLQVGNCSALEKAVNCFYLAGIEDVRVIVGHRADEVIPLVNRLNAKWVFNESFQEGMLSSVLTGVRSLEPGIEAFFLLPVDVPLVKQNTVEECLRIYRGRGAKVVYPCFQGLQGHPPLIERGCVAELTAGCRGGLRAFLERYRPEAAYVNVLDRGVVMECNTPEEYRKVWAYSQREDIPTERECDGQVHECSF